MSGGYVKFSVKMRSLSHCIVM